MILVSCMNLDKFNTCTAVATRKSIMELKYHKNNIRGNVYK